MKEKEKYIKIKLDLEQNNDLLLSKIYEKISRGSKKKVIFNALLSYIRDKNDDNLADIFNINASEIREIRKLIGSNKKGRRGPLGSHTNQIHTDLTIHDEKTVKTEEIKNKPIVKQNDETSQEEISELDKTDELIEKMKNLSGL